MTERKLRGRIEGVIDDENWMRPAMKHWSEAEINDLLNQLIADNPDKAKQARVKPNLAGWFLGQAMKESHGVLNPTLVVSLLKTKGIG